MEKLDTVGSAVDRAFLMAIVRDSTEVQLVLMCPVRTFSCIPSGLKGFIHI